ncbi:MAG: hypothetical protein IIV77_08625, partial [Bacteroidaceae bacterium]|nr:hypothetical protein [Bacteroidaceae bacterium]
MKRSLTIFVFAFVAFSNLFGQAIETPTCYAYMPGRESTLKFKYSYEEESFYLNFRFIKGSQNAFEVGDKIIMEASNGKAITFCVSENMLKQDNNEYIPFEISAEEMNILQNGIMSISIVRQGERFVLEQNEYYRTLTQKNGVSGYFRLVWPYSRIKSYLCLMKSDQLLRAILPDVLIDNFDVVDYQK